MEWAATVPASTFVGAGGGSATAQASVDSVNDPAGSRTARDEESDRVRELRTVRRAQGGDVAAFEELYRANVGRVFAVCYRMSGTADRAEELVQDVFVRAWEKLHLFRGDSAFFSWLYPLAVNLIYSAKRASTRHESRVTATDDLEAFDSPAGAPQPHLSMDLERAIQGLPRGARHVFVLHDVEGYKHAEIAEMTGLAVGTSKAQLHRARRMLQEVLAR